MGKKTKDFIKKGFKLKEGFILISLGFLVTWGTQYSTCKKTFAEADLNISFCIKDVDPYSPLTMPNSCMIYDPPTPQFVRPNNTKLNEITIRNKSKLKASSVDISLRVKDPFVICLVSLNSEKHPKSDWSIKRKDEEQYKYLTINLTRINSKDDTQIYIVYSHLSEEINKEKKIYEKALNITIDTASQNNTISEDCNLEYYYDISTCNDTR